MRVGIQVAVCMIAVMASLSRASAQVASNEVEPLTGDVWVSRSDYLLQRTSRTADDVEVLTKPLPADAATPDLGIVVPLEFKLNLTLTIRHDDKQFADRGTRHRRSTSAVHRGGCYRHGVRPAHYGGDAVTPRESL